LPKPAEVAADPEGAVIAHDDLDHLARHKLVRDLPQPLILRRAPVDPRQDDRACGKDDPPCLDPALRCGQVKKTVPAVHSHHRRIGEEPVAQCCGHAARQRAHALDTGIFHGVFKCFETAEAIQCRAEGQLLDRAANDLFAARSDHRDALVAQAQRQRPVQKTAGLLRIGVENHCEEVMLEKISLEKLALSAKHCHHTRQFAHLAAGQAMVFDRLADPRHVAAVELPALAIGMAVRVPDRLHAATCLFLRL
jgi:hypothetical protein